MIEAAGGVAMAVAVNVSKKEDCEAMVQAAVDKWGTVDILVNNAGLIRDALIHKMTEDQWDLVQNVILKGTFLCTQAAFRIMKDQKPMGGRIINNGSISAHAPRPHSIAYTATKHAVTGLTKAASLDGRRYDIAVGQIDIGNAQTPLAARMAKGVPQANGEIAVEPLMDVEIVGQSVLYMASLPLEANVLFHTVMATKMPFVGRG